MKTRILSKLFIFLMTATVVAGSSYGYSEAEQSIQTTVQPAVAIEKLSSSIENGTVDPQTGVHTGLKSVFSLKTNGTDKDYDFIITSRITDDSGAETSAYGENGCILFGHTLAMPTQNAIDDAKSGGSNNINVIAYPVSATITNPMEVNYERAFSNYGDCYVVKVNSEMDGTVTHSVNPNPVSGTYNITQDQAGTYKSTVYFTAVSK